tara:strand:+ start:292 stop:1473 length:1182 start_codon:yes stop_codon:yes gene_type:complete
MAEELENVTEEVTEQPIENTIDESKFQSAGDDSVIKVDLSKPPVTQETNETTETEADTAGMVGRDETPNSPQEQEEVQPQGEVQETEIPVLEEITEEEVQQAEEQVVEAIAEAEATGKPLPENVQKLVDFMEDTGGDLNDYVSLNRDLEKLDDSEILDEYYRNTKSHLSASERNFLLEDKFGFDEDMDDERTIKSKKIALKEQVAEARSYLDDQKTKYYEEIKAGSKLTSEQQKAIDFFNRYNKESEEAKKLADSSKEIFQSKTNNLFNDKFKGFDYNVGDKKYRFNVKNTEDVKQTQSDINNFIQKFLDDKNQMKDAQGYHKSLFTAMNADAIAQHFYEQGKADAIKDTVAKGKNIDVNPRGTHGSEQTSGMKVRVLGEDSNDFKFKIRKRK